MDCGLNHRAAFFQADNAGSEGQAVNLEIGDVKTACRQEIPGTIHALDRQARGIFQHIGDGRCSLVVNLLAGDDG